MKRRWKPLLIGAGVFLGLIAAFAIWIHVVATRRWDDILRRAKEIEAELAAPLERAPLRGQALPGNAWDDYLRILPGGPSPKIDRDLEAFLKGSPVDREEVRGFVNVLAPLVETVRQGSRRALVRRPAGAALQSRAVLVARVQARFTAESGALAEAFRILVDVIRVGQDEAGSATTKLGALSGYLTAGQALDDLHFLLRRDGASAADLEALAREAEILERSIPAPGRFLLMEIADTARTAENVGVFGFSFASGGPGWRYAGSGRLHVAATLGIMEDAVRLIRERRDLPWPDIEEVREELLFKASRSRNALLGLLSSHVLLERYAWDVRARLRLTRAAALFRARGEKAAIDDPFGGTLTWDDQGVRSRGSTDDPKDDIILRLKP